MFRVISIITFVIAFAAILLSAMKSKNSTLSLKTLPARITRSIFARNLTLFTRLKALFCLAAVFFFFVLLVTGFYPAVILNTSLTGYFLIIHNVAAGAFAVCLTFLVPAYAQKFTFTTSEFSLYRLTFWILVILALPLILSITLSMFKLFSTDQLRLLADLHACFALAFAVTAILHLYLALKEPINRKSGTK